MEDFQRVVALFPRNTKYCFNGPNKGLFVLIIHINANTYILNTLRSFCQEEEVKNDLKRLPNKFAFHPRPKNCRLWKKTGRGLIWVEKRQSRPVFLNRWASQIFGWAAKPFSFCFKKVILYVVIINFIKRQPYQLYKHQEMTKLVHFSSIKCI